MYATVLIALAGQGQSERLTPRITLAPPPHYVGQAIDASISVVAPSLPIVEAPSGAEAMIVAAGMEMRPLVVSAIGDQVRESSAFAFRYRIVPNAAGSIRIAPFRVRLGGESSATIPVSFSAKQPPLEGRPIGFLGGIGGVSVSCRLDPQAIRLGQSSTLRITLAGLGSFGSRTRPEVNGGDGVSIEAEAERFAPDAPRRSWTYRLRPDRPGEHRLAPIVVATFDPQTRRYVSEVLPSTVLRVAAPPVLEPRSIVVVEATPPHRLPPGPIVVAVVLAAAVPMAVALRMRPRRGAGPRRYARRGARRLQAMRSEELAAEVTALVTQYLHLAGGRPEGALGPTEARTSIAQATGSAELADAAATLIDEADRYRFGGSDRIDPSYRHRAVEFFRRLANPAGRKGPPPDPRALT